MQKPSLPSDVELVQIAAVAQNGVIGRDGGLPWRLPTDLKFFKAQTNGHSVIMGRKTFEEIKRKPLPGRLNIVVSRNLETEGLPKDFVYVRTIDDAVKCAVAELERFPSPIFIVGGGEIYRQTMPWCHRLLITHIHAHIDGDTTYPEVNTTAYTKTVLATGEEAARLDANGSILQPPLGFEMVEYTLRMSPHR